MTGRNPNTATGPFARAAAEARQRRSDQIAALQHDHEFDRFRTVPARRALVVVGYAAMLVSTGIAWIDPDGLASVAAPVLFLIGVAVVFALRRVVRHADDTVDGALDERLTAVRDKAFRRAYPGLVFVVLAGLLAMMLGLGDAVEHRHLQAAFYGLGLGALITPLALMAWSPREL